MLSVMKNSNFFKLFAGRISTNAADSIYYVAAMWMVYELGGSAFYTGLAGFLVLIPQVLQFLSGPIIDRIPIRKLLTFTQISQAILILSIPVAYELEMLTVSMVLVVMPFISLLNQVAYPATSAVIPLILPKDQLTKGNSLMSFAYQGIDMVFNALSGIFISLLGAVTLFWTDSVIFFLAALLYWRIFIPEQETEKKEESKTTLKQETKKYFQDLKEGFQIVLKSAIVKLFGENIVANFALGMMMATLPAYADFRGGPETYGAMLAAFSAGVLIGSLMAPLFEKIPLGKLTVISFVGGASCWIISAYVEMNWLSVVLFGASSIPIGLTNVLFFTILQGSIPQKYLARVFSVIASISSCAMPLGSLIGGALTTVYSSFIIFVSAGYALFFISIYILFVPVLRKMPSVKNASEAYFGFDRVISEQSEAR